jgi:hypothetical protein
MDQETVIQKFIWFDIPVGAAGPFTQVQLKEASHRVNLGMNRESLESYTIWTSPALACRSLCILISSATMTEIRKLRLESFPLRLNQAQTQKFFEGIVKLSCDAHPVQHPSWNVENIPMHTLALQCKNARAINCCVQCAVNELNVEVPHVTELHVAQAQDGMMHLRGMTRLDTLYPNLESVTLKGPMCFLSCCKDLHLLGKKWSKNVKRVSLKLASPLPTLSQQFKGTAVREVHLNILRAGTSVNSFFSVDFRPTYQSLINANILLSLRGCLNMSQLRDVRRVVQADLSHAVSGEPQTLVSAQLPSLIEMGHYFTFDHLEEVPIYEDDLWRRMAQTYRGRKTMALLLWASRLRQFPQCDSFIRLIRYYMY